MHTLLQLRSRILPVCPSYTWAGSGWNTGAFRPESSCASTGVAFSCSLASSRSSGVAITVHTRTFRSWPAAARYLPSLENTSAQTALPMLSPFCSKAEDVDIRLSAGLGDGPLPSSSCARNTRSNVFSFLYWARTFRYFDGAGCRGMNPIG